MGLFSLTLRKKVGVFGDGLVGRPQVRPECPHHLDIPVIGRGYGLHNPTTKNPMYPRLDVPVGRLIWSLGWLEHPRLVLCAGRRKGWFVVHRGAIAVGWKHIVVFGGTYGQAVVVGFLPVQDVFD